MERAWHAWTAGGLLRLAAVALQLAVIVAAIRIFNIETNAFETVAMLALGGFVVHHLLPAPARLPFFALLSVASVVIVLGIAAGTSLLVLGAILIAACHIHVSHRARIAIVLAVGAAYAVLRLAPAWLPAGAGDLVPGSIWPILGSMFMFRLVVYLYDLRHGTAPSGFWRAVAYFFMLPNVCFPLFPVVDYQTFDRNRYNDEPFRIYQSGVKWILRGVVQLLLYRFIYMHGVIAIEDVHNLVDVGRYMLSTFMLYLKISGTFHLVIGILHLFGFNLPETHHLYLLSSSFTDFWRRINIYWKDFITKIVFFPLYFRWRKGGDARAVIVATLVAFVATWALHSYQWFWIRGTFPIVWSDLVFWLGLGIIVVLNVRWEQRRGRMRTLRAAPRTLESELGLGLRTAGTFAAICTLWTIWSTPDPADVRVLLHAATQATPLQVLAFIGVPLLIGLCGVVLGRRTREHTEGVRAQAVRRTDAFWPSALRIGALAAALLAIAVRPVLLDFAPPLVQVAQDLKSRGLNQADAQALHRGYYEELGDVTRFDNELWRLYGLQPKDWGREMDVMEDRTDRMFYSYLPNVSGTLNGAPFTTNSDSLRDRDYVRAKPPGTFRIALIGASHDAGVGVATDSTYENIAEAILDARARASAAAGGPARVEIVNFSAAGYAPIQKLAVAEMRVPSWAPDVVAYAVNRNELVWAFFRVEDLIARGSLDEYPFLVEALAQAGVDRHAPPSQAVLERTLEPQAEAVMQRVLERFVERVRGYGARPILVLLELPPDDKRPPALVRLAEIGAAVGCEVVDLYGAMSGVADRATLAIATWDDHTNARGHALLGRKFAEMLVSRGIVPLGAATALPAPVQSGE